MFIYSIKDCVTGEFGSPIIEMNNNAAIRRFNYLMDNAQMIAPDCQLYCLGAFDVNTGCIDGECTFICGYSKKVD